MSWKSDMGLFIFGLCVLLLGFFYAMNYNLYAAGGVLVFSIGWLVYFYKRFARHAETISNRIEVKPIGDELIRQAGIGKVERKK